jgi:hypothetical protein
MILESAVDNEHLATCQFTNKSRSIPSKLTDSTMQTYINRLYICFLILLPLAGLCSYGLCFADLCYIVWLRRYLEMTNFLSQVIIPISTFYNFTAGSKERKIIFCFLFPVFRNYFNSFNSV